MLTFLCDIIEHTACEQLREGESAIVSGTAQYTLARAPQRCPMLYGTRATVGGGGDCGGGGIVSSPASSRGTAVDVGGAVNVGGAPAVIVLSSPFHPSVGMSSRKTGASSSMRCSRQLRIQRNATLYTIVTTTPKAAPTAIAAPSFGTEATEFLVEVAVMLVDMLF